MARTRNQTRDTTSTPVGTADVKVTQAVVPLGDTTNGSMRTRTKFDDDGEVAIVTEERVSVPKSDIAAASPAREASCGKKDEYEAEENVEEVGEDGQVAHDEKLKYRAIPSLFSEERCRTAKFEGVHTRFEDKDEDDCTAVCSPDVQATVSKLAEQLAKSMDVDGEAK